MLWILRPVLIPLPICLIGRILLVGIGVCPSVPLFSTSIFSCMEKYFRLHTLSLWGKDDIDLVILNPWYELPLGECWRVAVWQPHCFGEVVKLDVEMQETNPISRFSIKPTDYACLGEGPKLITSLALASHFGCSPPSCRQFLRE